MRLSLIPVTLRDAHAFVARWHRHHRPSRGGKFAVAVAAEDGEIVGVAVVGRPIARHLDDGWTVEVNRVATDGTRNACSMLYSAAWRAARAMGYRRCVTYTLEAESGASLRGAGWRCVAEAARPTWSESRTDGRPYVEHDQSQTKLRWEAVA